MFDKTGSGKSKGVFDFFSQKLLWVFKMQPNKVVQTAGAEWWKAQFEWNWERLNNMKIIGDLIRTFHSIEVSAYVSIREFCKVEF